MNMNTLGNVMLLDDDCFCNRMNTFVIEQINAAKSIITFEAAMDALQYLEGLIKEEKYDDFPDVILLDLNMTFMSGWGFLEKFSAFSLRYKQKASVYILTSSIQTSDRKAAALHAEVSGYIEKPFTTLELEYVMAEQQSRVLQ